MCTLVVLRGVVEGDPLVIAANRDEHYDRPTVGPQLLDPAHGIVGGRDLRAGGTWLAVRRGGAVAALTNQPVAVPTRADRSRGELPLGVLRRSPDEAEAWLRDLPMAAFNPFNLLWGDRERLRVAYGRPEGITIEDVPEGITVLPNGRLDNDGPEVRRARVLLKEPVVEGTWCDRLRAVLGDHETPDDPPPGPRWLSPEVRRAVRALCVHTPHYGTRSAALLFFAESGPPRYLHADGPPCTTPFRDVSNLLRG